MFCAFSTAPADDRKTSDTGRGRALLTWLLAGLWTVLISFAIVSSFEPQWLKELGDSGAKVEAKRYKHAGDDLLLNQGKPHQAITLYEKALTVEPNNVGALINKAIAHIQAGGRERGLRILLDALKRDDCRKGIIYYNLGEQLALQGELSDAAECYRRALATGEVEDVLVYRQLGLLHMKTANLEEARFAFERSLAGQVDPVTPYRNMLRRSLGPYEDDPEHLEVIQAELQNTRPDSLELRYDLQIMADIRVHDADIAKTHNYLGFIKSKLGKTAEARDHYRRSLDIWPGNTDASSNLALLE